MRTFVKCLVVALLLSFSSTATAQQYTRYRIPTGTRITQSGQTYQGFNLGEYQELLRMDEDLRYLTEASRLHETRISELNASISNLQMAVNTAQRSITVLESERSRLTELWTEENRLRRVAEERPDWNWIPWTLTGVLALTTVVLSLVLGIT